MMIVQFER